MPDENNPELIKQFEAEKKRAERCLNALRHIRTSDTHFVVTNIRILEDKMERLERAGISFEAAVALGEVMDACTTVEAFLFRAINPHYIV